jgi:hypothetical protein
MAVAVALVSRMGTLRVASATVIESAPGNINCTSYAGACTGPLGTTVAITPHSLWQPNGPNGSSAVWISYDKTGIAPVLGAPGWQRIQPHRSLFHNDGAGAP